MRRNKYNNIKVEFDGHKFDSKKEAARYAVLKHKLGLGEIKELVCHPRYKLIVPDLGPVLIKGDKRNTISSYTADFEYLTKDGERVIEDVKSSITAKDKYFKLKRAIFELIYQIDIKLV